jgi:single-strand DNA-binding protein
MPSYQKVLIVGHVGRSPEMRYTPSGVPVTSFSVAVDEYVGKEADGSAKTEAVWFRVSAWRKQAEYVAQYVPQGALVMVEGRVKAQAFTDREGNARASLELTADKVLKLSKDQADAMAGLSGSDDGADEIPF